MSADEIAGLEALAGWSWQPRTIPADVRDRAKQLHADGKTYGQIAKQFMAEGIRNTTGQAKWTSARIRRLVEGSAGRTVTASVADRWDGQYRQLLAHTAAHGPLAARNRGIDKQVSQWITHQRTAHRDGKLSAEQTALLEAIPGWTWQRPTVPTELRRRAQRLLAAGMEAGTVARQFTADGVLNAYGEVKWTRASINKLAGQTGPQEILQATVNRAA